MTEATRAYPDVPQQASFPEIERRVLDFWRREQIFRAQVEARPAGENGANEYVFYDGPPFANGLPHYGHLLTGFVKDVIPRYQTLRGRRVERRFGWDCHGLPAEMEAEKELGVSGHAAISEYGIERFNDYCRSSVLRYTEAWREIVTRQARWVDFQNDYKTMDLSYMESVMWAFKQLWSKGLVYEGYRVMPYSWAAETVLSNFETRLDNATRPRQDPAITVRFELAPVRGDGAPLDLWVWTTTPWTLPSNLALAVGPDSAPRRSRSTRASSRARGPWAACAAASWSDAATARSSTSSRPSRTRFACSPPTSSTPPRARASSTWRPASAKRTWRSARARASAWWFPSTTAAASRARCRRGKASWCSTPTPTSSGGCASATRSCATRRSCTTTRTAGAPTSR
jgi:hypothetical protein